MRPESTFHFQDPTWCPGCGLYALFSALKKAAVALEMRPEQIVLVTGIGCHGRLSNTFRAYTFHGLHGRVLPVATGVKLANSDLHVLGVSGDGDAYAIGCGHFIHTVRRNPDITYVVVNNMIYGLTQGQTSPTSPEGFVSRFTPFGSVEKPVNGLRLALASGGTFVARGFSGEPRALAELIQKGLSHRGFALIEVLSPCVTQNKVNTYDWFKSRLYHVEQDPAFDPQDPRHAWQALQRPDVFAVGLVYEGKRETFEERILGKSKPLVRIPSVIRRRKIERVLERFE